MMELLVGEADEAIKTDVEVARELIACSGLEAEGERLALVEVDERRTRICINIESFVANAERQGGADAEDPVALADASVVASEERNVHEPESIIIGTIERFTQGAYHTPSDTRHHGPME